MIRGLTAVAAALLLSGCASIPPTAIGAVAGAAGAFFRLDQQVLQIVTGPTEGKQMPFSATIPNDSTATYKLTITDQVGRALTPPAGGSLGGSIGTDNTSVATAALSPDGTEFTITPVAQSGTANLSYNNGGATFNGTVTVVSPTPSNAAVGDPVFTPLPAPAAAEPAAAQGAAS